MLTPNDIAAVPELEALAARMLPEVLATPRSAWVPMPAATMYKGDWLALLFSAGPWAQEFPGVDLAANLERFPEAAALLARHPEITVFGVLALAPGAELLPHRDRRADDEVRVHIPMQLGSADGAPWVLGKARLLDIRELHHSDDPGLQARITLVADVKVGRAVAEGEVAPVEPGAYAVALMSGGVGADPRGMADPLKSTVAIVATPKAMEDVRARLRDAGIRTGQVEVAAVRVERETTPDRTVPVLVNRRVTLFGAGVGAALGLLLVAGWMGLIAWVPALCGLLGGAAVGALLAATGSAILAARGVAPTKMTRDYWKIRVLGDASLLARARGLASRSGVTLRRLATDAFEVQVPPPIQRPGKR